MATIIATEPILNKVDTNMAATTISWEGQPIWLIMAYFPNALKGTKVTITALRNILRTIKDKRVILAGDFNSTETLSLFDSS
jgi:endonuclease/exonuclease/phosphatase (EEP) superfamily protein YafD